MGFNIEQFSKKIRTLRLDNEMTTEEFAKAVGTDNGTISRWENGLRIPSVFAIHNIAKAFNISSDSLLGLDD